MTKVFKQFTILITLLVVLLAAEQTKAQIETELIRVERVFLGKNFYVGDEEHSRREIKEILYNSASSQKLMKSSKNDKIFGYVTLGTGILYTAYAYIGSWQAYSGTYTPASIRFRETIHQKVIAVGLNLAGLSQLNSSKRKFYQAIKAYNRDLASADFEYKIYLGYNRVSLVVFLN